MKLTFICVSAKSVKMKSLKDFLNMSLVFIGVIRVDQNVIKIYNHKDVHNVREDVIHEALESGQNIDKSERHNQPFKELVLGLKAVFHSSLLTANL